MVYYVKDHKAFLLVAGLKDVLIFYRHLLKWVFYTGMMALT
jgi:hypothetical protein